MNDRTVLQVLFDTTIVITAIMTFWLAVAYAIGIIS